MEQRKLLCKKHNIDFVLGTLSTGELDLSSEGMVDITRGMPNTTKFLYSCSSYADKMQDDNGDFLYTIGEHKWKLTDGWKTFAYPYHDYRSMKAAQEYDGDEYIRQSLVKEYNHTMGATMVLCDKEFASKLSMAVRMLCSKGHLVREEGGIVYVAGQNEHLTALFIPGDYPQNKKAKRVLLTAYADVLCVFAAIGHGSWKLLYKTEGHLPSEFIVVDSVPIRRAKIPSCIKTGWVTPESRKDNLSIGANFYEMLKAEDGTNVSCVWRNAIC